MELLIGAALAAAAFWAYCVWVGARKARVDIAANMVLAKVAQFINVHRREPTDLELVAIIAHAHQEASQVRFLDLHPTQVKAKSVGQSALLYINEAMK